MKGFLMSVRISRSIQVLFIPAVIIVTKETVDDSDMRAENTCIGDVSTTFIDYDNDYLNRWVPFSSAYLDWNRIDASFTNHSP
jgi:hypothetical protein